MARAYALEELRSLITRPYSRSILGENAISGGRNELCEEKARDSQPSKHISDSTNCVFEPCSERAFYDDNEMEEGEIREDEASVMHENAGIQMHHSSRQVDFRDYKIAELNIREGDSSFLGENGANIPMHKTGQRTTSATSDELEEGEIMEEFDGFQCFKQPNTEVWENNFTRETGKKTCLSVELLKKQIEDTCSRRLEGLLLRQKLELTKFKISRKQQEMELLKGYGLDLDKLCDMDIDRTVRERRTKSLKREFAKLKDRFDQHMLLQYKNLVVIQMEARNREKEIKECWIERAKGGTLKESFEELPLSETGFNLVKFACNGKCTNDGGPEISPQNTDSCSNFIEFVTATDEYQPAETCAIASVGTPQDKPRKQESPGSLSICTDRVQASETTMSHYDSSEQIPKELPIPSHVYESSKQNTNEMDPSIGVSSNLLPVVQLVGEENTCVVSQTPVSQSNTGAASGMFEVVTASSVSAVAAGKKDGGTGSYSVFSEDACSQSQKELPGSSHVSESFKKNTNEMDSSVGVSFNSLLVVQRHVGEENTSAVSQTPVSQSDAGAASSMFEAVATGLVSAAAVGKEDGGTGSYFIFSKDACSRSQKKLPVSSHVRESSKQREIIDLCDEVPEGASFAEQEQNNHPLAEPAHPLAAITNDLPARTGSEGLRPSDTQLGTINQLLSVAPTMPQEEFDSSPLHFEFVRIQKLSELITQTHQQKRAQLVGECEKEIAKARKKYNALICDVETDFFHTKKKIESVHDKINKHQMLAAEFREIFKMTTGRISNTNQGPFTREQHIQPSQRQSHHIPSSAHISPSLPSSLNPGTRGPFPRPSLFLPGERPGPLNSATRRPPPGVQHNAGVLLSRPTNLEPSMMHHTVSNLTVGSTVRAPAPHLCRRPSDAPNLRPAV